MHDRRYVPDGAYLVKPVVALPGDRVCNQGGVFLVNDEIIGRVLTQDGGGRPSPMTTRAASWPMGSSTSPRAIREASTLEHSVP